MTELATDRNLRVHPAFLNLIRETSLEPFIADGETVEITGPRTARVASKSTPGNWYAVDLDGNGGRGECTCRAYEIRRKCRHITAVARFAAGTAETALPTDEPLVAFRLFTSRYMNREPLSMDIGLVPVGISNKPHFLANLPYRERIVYVSELVPRGLPPVTFWDDFARLYRANLDTIGVAPLQRRFSAIAKDTGAPSLVLLSYAKVLSGESDHRRVFAEWWQDMTGDEVTELEGDA